MKIKTLLILQVAILLSACAYPRTLEPAPTATLPTIPELTQTPAQFLTPTSPTSSLAMNCDDWVLLDLGEYQAQNNTWGKGTLSGWSQCIGIGNNDDGTIIARWTWDWLNAGGNVKAYPEIVFGQKPGSSTTSASLPAQINSINSATVSYDVVFTYTGSGNLAFDIWLTDTANPSTWGVPPITHEIMIWLDYYGSMNPGGVWQGRENIGGYTYSVYVGEKYGEGWRYIAFVRAPSQQGAETLELVAFFNYLRENDLVTGEEYLASIEFGNEVAGGTGETLLNQYSISIQAK